MRQGPWKLIQTKGTPSLRYQLFNLKQDLSETQDLATQYPKRVDSMRRALTHWKTDMEQTRTSQPSHNVEQPSKR